MSGVSASVESGLVQQLQTEIAALRDENRDIGHDLHETELECTAHLKEVAMLRDENERLRQELAELKAQPPPPPKVIVEQISAPPAEPAAVPNAEELEREIVAALREALGGAEWEAAAGAARRRANKSSNAIAAAAVRTAKRAQHAWLTEHNKLRDEAIEAQRAEAARAAELEEAMATIRRLKSEVRASQRGQGDVRGEQGLRTEPGRRLEVLATPPPPPPLPPAEPPAEHGSAFVAFMEAKQQQKQQQQQQQQHARSRGADAAAMAKSPRSRSSADATSLPPLGDGGGGTRLPRLPSTGHNQKSPAATHGEAPASVPLGAAGDAALRSMTEALQSKWQRHVAEQTSRGGRASFMSRVHR